MQSACSPDGPPHLILRCTGSLVVVVKVTPGRYIACVRNLNCEHVEPKARHGESHSHHRVRPLLTRDVFVGICNYNEDDDVERQESVDELGQHCGAFPAKHSKVQNPLTTFNLHH